MDVTKTFNYYRSIHEYNYVHNYMVLYTDTEICFRVTVLSSVGRVAQSV